MPGILAILASIFGAPAAAGATGAALGTAGAAAGAGAGLAGAGGLAGAAGAAGLGAKALGGFPSVAGAGGLAGATGGAGAAGGGFLSGLGDIIGALGPSYKSDKFSISFDREGQERKEMMSRLFAILEGPQVGRGSPTIQRIGGNQGGGLDITQMGSRRPIMLGGPMGMGMGLGARFPGLQ